MADPASLSLDEQVAYHENASANLKRRINCQRSAIYRLPPEVLSLIFLNYRKQLELHVDYGAGTIAPTYRWIWITHVCHHWREVALNTAQLWTEIYIESSQKADERIRASIERSNGAPLTIVYKNHTPGSLKLLRNLAPDIVHAASLTLHIPTSTMMEDVAISFPSHAPFLRHLEIEDTYSWGTGSSHSHPIFFKKCSAPILQDLTARYIQLDWSSGTLPRSLTRLHVNNSRTGTKVPVEEVVAGLAHLNNLECIDLCQVLQPTLPQNTSLQPSPIKVEVSHLRRLTVGASTSSCARLLAALEFPAAQMKLTLDVPSDVDVQPIAALARTLADRVEQLSPEMIALRIHTGVSGTLEICKGSRATNELQSGETNPQLDDARPYIRITQTATHSGLHTVTNTSQVLEHFIHFLTRMPLATVTIASLRTVLSTSTTAFQVLSVIPNTSTLVIHPKATSLQPVQLDDVAEVLSCTTDADSPIFYLPRLRHLVLHDVEFGDVESVGDAMNVAGMIEAVKARKEAESAIERITIRRCTNMDEEEVIRLHEFVGVVDWDRIVIEDPEMGDDIEVDDDPWGAYGDEDPYGDEDAYDEGYDEYDAGYEDWLQGMDTQEFHGFIAGIQQGGHF
ncbi:hypothetical protein EIP91_012345 [Steccherinum ochraceum]|uniref:Uncharacterized protein n=1 Tax=Steccherinum ochraceum TaxID=92696 RepID=A0A4R0RX31_9APHY|nr:hypothetical protein EIP91_012345 [Steccherinum ochraceum]